MPSDSLTLPPHVKTRALDIQTELEELATVNKLHLPQSVPRGSMLEVRKESAIPSAAAARWPCASGAAVEHPGLLGIARRLHALGYRLAIDTSLRPTRTATAPASEPRGRGGGPAELLASHLRTIGAYFSQRRRCVGLAVDSSWHELMHEVCHANFDARVRRVKAEKAAHQREPLLLHFEQLRARGHSEHGAEQIMCHTHELHALRSRPSVGAAGRALLVWDNMNLDAFRDLSAIAPAERSAVQAAELRRLTLLRSFVTGPAPRLGACVAAVVAVVATCASLRVRAAQALTARARPREGPTEAGIPGGGEGGM